jgi:hypothetical protein
MKTVDAPADELLKVLCCLYATLVEAAAQSKNAADVHALKTEMTVGVASAPFFQFRRTIGGTLSSLSDTFAKQSSRKSDFRLCRASVASLYVRGIFLPQGEIVIFANFISLASMRRV